MPLHTNPKMNSCFLIHFQVYLMDSSSESVGKVLQSCKEGVYKTAKLTVNYYTATQTDAYSYVKVAW